MEERIGKRIDHLVNHINKIFGDAKCEVILKLISGMKNRHYYDSCRDDMKNIIIF